MRNSIKAAAPLVVLLGCYFHFSQVLDSPKFLTHNVAPQLIIQRVKKAGLAWAYAGPRTNNKFNSIIR